MLSLTAKQIAKHAVQSAEYRACTGSVVKHPCIPDFTVTNEPIKQYRLDSPERIQLAAVIKQAEECVEEVPIVIGKDEICEGEPHYQVMPHDNTRKIARFYYASDTTIKRAIAESMRAQSSWDKTPLKYRICIWLQAAELMANQYRQSLNAATMLGQSKTAIQAEIDSACELIDFFRFNALFLKEAATYKPISTNPNVLLNSLRFRGIDGFIAAISPFNFTAIGGNLAYTPALMGNAVIWKPSDTAILSNWRIFNILREAGLPDGVVNFVPADGPTFGHAITGSPLLGGINFTGSVPTFNRIWGDVAKNISIYRHYPRLSGECGGKNYHFVHCSANVDTVVACTIRSAFEYCGQKCSACSRLFIPKSLYCPIVQGLLAAREKLKVGDPRDLSVFMGAVIDKNAYQRITGYIEKAKKNPCNKIHGGGAYCDKPGYFIQPTIIETTDLNDALLREEIFGPVLAFYAYDDNKLWETLSVLGTSTAFALTGALFATDYCFLERALDELRYTAGNFYINDKSTGAVVAQQPFGGGRKSGTNDKAGGPNYIMRWTSPQTIKETFVPMPEIIYPYMSD